MVRTSLIVGPNETLKKFAVTLAAYLGVSNIIAGHCAAAMLQGFVEGPTLKNGDLVRLGREGEN